MKTFITFLFTILTFVASAQNLDRVEPPNWWAGMKSTQLQLLVHGENISQTDVTLNYPGVNLESVTKVENPNYLFLDLKLASNVKPGKFNIEFKRGKKLVATYLYELWEREANSANRVGFNASDMICLITPDRFVNGDPGNDEVPGMKEGLDRSYKWGRHGGDIRGIINSLDYLQNLGYTAVWLNPVLENDMPKESYHGYATTDFYKVDARFGTNDEYRELNKELDKRGMKLIMDMIFNHCGSEHWWMHDMPMKDWINNYPDMKITNHRRTVNEDPHASQVDISGMVDGWFVPAMPDMNQRNPFVARYLIQNSIWWTEYVGLEGIRQDTWPYPDKNMMSEWTKEMLEEYPDFNIVGEEWSGNPAIVSYWQKGKYNQDGYKNYAPSMMDFPLQSAVASGLKNDETWDTGLIQIYEALSNDFLYPDPYKLTIFPDNHDMSRFFVQVGEDVNLLKMGVAFFLTTRGIPQIYYGTEILMRHDGSEHGDIRADFPGGWAGDKVNAFTGEGLSDAAKDMQKYVANLQNWRKNATVIHNGKLMHFIPENGTYAYFRYTDNEAVMVILNKNEEEKTITTDRFKEVMDGYRSGKEIISGQQISDISSITVPAKSAVVVELKK
ncbi:glycoside hydrolase family 13 protein [Maribellus sp. YY47]|uniref:glycoside hydrolase family 13 protein n=1 Tax=Maribellus sp. YY47 TaxID=2929486 RepID=UPI002000A992|nr:glycoside hydrolase family 13 protein [Maribellus sp. YY47]MCK3685938.1 glycoside hydrolase family 13 protein [Maribellus sp. YY47]